MVCFLFWNRFFVWLQMNRNNDSTAMITMIAIAFLALQLKSEWTLERTLEWTLGQSEPVIHWSQGLISSHNRFGFWTSITWKTRNFEQSHHTWSQTWHQRWWVMWVKLRWARSELRVSDSQPLVAHHRSLPPTMAAKHALYWRRWSRSLSPSNGNQKAFVRSLRLLIRFEAFYYK